VWSPERHFLYTKEISSSCKASLWPNRILTSFNLKRPDRKRRSEATFGEEACVPGHSYGTAPRSWRCTGSRPPACGRWCPSRCSTPGWSPAASGWWRAVDTCLQAKQVGQYIYTPLVSIPDIGLRLITPDRGVSVLWGKRQPSPPVCRWSLCRRG